MGLIIRSEFGGKVGIPDRKLGFLMRSKKEREKREVEKNCMNEP